LGLGVGVGWAENLLGGGLAVYPFTFMDYGRGSVAAVLPHDTVSVRQVVAPFATVLRPVNQRRSVRRIVYTVDAHRVAHRAGSEASAIPVKLALVDASVEVFQTARVSPK
jgi:hypothetical protein